MRLALLCGLISLSCLSTIHSMEGDLVWKAVREWFTSQPTPTDEKQVRECMRCDKAPEVPEGGSSGVFYITDSSDIPCLRALFRYSNPDCPEQRNGEVGKKKKKRRKKSSRKDPVVPVMQDGPKVKKKSLRQLARMAKEADDYRLLERARQANREATECALITLRDAHRERAEKSKTEIYYAQERYGGVPVYLVYDRSAWYIFKHYQLISDSDNARKALDPLQKIAKKNNRPAVYPTLVKAAYIYFFSGEGDNARFAFEALIAAIGPDGEKATEWFRAEERKLFRRRREKANQK